MVKLSRKNSMLKKTVLFPILGFLVGWIRPAQTQARFQGREEIQVGTIEHQGRKRNYLLHLPSGYDGKTSLPLVLVLHGGNGSAEGAVRMTGMNPKADRENFIAVYPNGSGKLRNRFLTWHAWDCCGYSLEHDVDDVGFIRALIERL